MSAALALSIMLAVVVAGLSAAVQSQRPMQGMTPPGARRPPSPRPASPPGAEHPVRKPRQRKKPEEETTTRPPTGISEHPSASRGPRPEPAHDPAESEAKGSELRRSGAQATATVLSVVDERTLGPVTRSRLTLKVMPKDGDPFEVQTRMAFPTPQSRSKVKVGVNVQVRYDPDDHHRVLVEIEGT